MAPIQNLTTSEISPKNQNLNLKKKKQYTQIRFFALKTV